MHIVVSNKQYCHVRWSNVCIYTSICVSHFYSAPVKEGAWAIWDDNEVEGVGEAVLGEIVGEASGGAEVGLPLGGRGKAGPPRCGLKARLVLGDGVRSGLASGERNGGLDIPEAGAGTGAGFGDRSITKSSVSTSEPPAGAGAGAPTAPPCWDNVGLAAMFDWGADAGGTAVGARGVGMGGGDSVSDLLSLDSVLFFSADDPKSLVSSVETGEYLMLGSSLGTGKMNPAA